MDDEERGFGLDNPKCCHDHIDDYNAQKGVVEECIECYKSGDRTQCPVKELLKNNFILKDLRKRF